MQPLQPRGVSSDRPRRESDAQTEDATKHFYWMELNRELRRTVGAAESGDELSDDELSRALVDGHLTAYARVLDKWSNLHPMLTHEYLSRRGLERSRSIAHRYWRAQETHAYKQLDAYRTAVAKNSAQGRRPPEQLSQCFSARFVRDFRRLSNLTLTARDLDMVPDERFPSKEKGAAFIATIVQMILHSPVDVQREMTDLFEGRTPDRSCHIAVHKLTTGVLAYLRTAEGLRDGERARIRAFLAT